MVITHSIVLKLVAVLGCTLIAGVFFAFSNFVMNALSRLSPAQGIAAMQSINLTLTNPLFMTILEPHSDSCSTGSGDRALIGIVSSE
jgi:uncharacterized membrane protein